MNASRIPFNSGNLFRTILVLLCIGYFANMGNAQPTDANETSLNVGKGLSGLKARTFHIDANSQIWIETEIGLDVWDGNAFNPISPPNFPVIKNPRHPGIVSNFGEDMDYIYICYHNNHQYYDAYNKKTKKFQSRPLPLINLNSKRQFTKSDQGHQPWLLTTNDSITVVTSINQDKEIPIIHTPNFGAVIDFAFCENGIWLMDEEYQTAHYNKEKGFIVFPTPNLAHPVDVNQASHAFLCDENNVLWFSIPGFAGLFRVHSNDKSPTSVENLPKDELVINCWMDKVGRKLIALSQEYRVVRHFMVSEKDRDFYTWDYLAKKSVIPTDLMSDDFYQRVHYGTHQGLDIFKFHASFLHKQLVEPSDAPNHYGNIIASIYEIDKKRVIISNEDRFSYMYDRESHRAAPPEDDFYQSIGQYPIYCPSNNSIQSIFRTSNYNITKLVSLNLTSKKTLQLDIPIFITDILHIPDSFLLISGEFEGASDYYIYNIFNSEITPLPTFSNSLLSHSNVNYTYYEPQAKKVYFCTYDHGLLVSDWSGHPEYLSPGRKVDIPELPDSNVISINRNYLGELLIGTYYGLYIVNPTSKELIRHITRKDGLSNNIVAAIEEDNRGFYWASTFYGLNVIDPTDYRIGRFFHEDGLSAQEFNRNASLKDSDGLVYFGSGNGVTIVKPEVFHNTKSNFEILFAQSEIITSDTTRIIHQLPTEPLYIPAQDFESIDIYIGNDDWGLIEDVTYFYRITGLEDNWKSTKESPIRIHRLPDGEFNIEIKALSRHGVWSDNTLLFPVEIYIPFFNQLWVRVSLVFLFLLTIGILLLALDRARLKQNFKFQKRVSNLELSLLQSQMNPHFIFNALGAIQYYIFSKEKDLAESYLSKFAGLMRMFLESSRNKFITLKDEVRLLEAYIELEHLRFPEKFESSVISNVKDTSRNYRLPSMLLQPFIENAINHGIFHSTKKGMLTVHFSDKDRNLICVIDDNGVGRKETKKIRMASIQKHKSRSTQITEERIEILKKADNMHIEIVYYDYDEEKDGRTGTRVTITIPSTNPW